MVRAKKMHRVFYRDWIERNSQLDTLVTSLDCCACRLLIHASTVNDAGGAGTYRLQKHKDEVFPTIRAK